MTYRPEIDGLRAIAVLSIVLYHAKVDLFSGGFVGVDIFFVISGYLITSILLKDLQTGRFSFLGFYERRLRRILPALLFMAIVVSAVSYAYLLPTELKNFGRSLAAMATFWANIFFYKESGYFDTLSESKPLLHTWSLSVEEQFYIFLPLIMFFIFKRFRANICLVLTIIAIISLILSLVMINKDPDGVFYLLHYRAWELLAGAILATSTRLQGLQFKNVLAQLVSAFALLLVCVPFFVYSYKTQFPGFTAVPVIFGTMVLIQQGQHGFAGKILSTPLFTSIGKISYPLYLRHWPLLTLPPLILARELTPLEISLCLAAALALSVFSWQFVENPVRTRKILLSRKKLFVCSAFCLLALAANGRLYRFFDGVPGRFPAEIMASLDEAGSFWAKSTLCLKGSESKDFSPCRIGSTDTEPSFILWGDSQAAAWAPGLEKIAREYKVSGLQYTMRSCAPMDGFIAPSSSEAEKLACLDFNKNIYQIIEDNKIENICLAGSFGAYMGGRKGLKGLMEPAKIKAQFEETVARLQAMGVTVWVVQGTPEYSNSVPEALAKALIRGDSVEQVSLPESVYKDFYRPVEEMIHNSSPNGLKILPIQPDICRGGFCLAGEGTRPFYSDFQHLSVFGSEYLNGTFKPMLEKLTN